MDKKTIIKLDAIRLFTVRGNQIGNKMLAEMVDSGECTAREIAEYYGVTTQAIHKRLARGRRLHNAVHGK